MIICKKPLVLYDVDAFGMGGLVLLTLAAAWLVVRPWQQTWQQYRSITAARAVALSKLNEDALSLTRLEQDLVPLQNAVTTQESKVPTGDALSRLLRDMTDVAKECALEVRSVKPQPAAGSGAYLVSDIQVGGRGRSRDFVRFLDRLAQENPYQSLQTCSISRPAHATEPACELAWTLRFYMMPQAAEPKRGGGS